MIGTVPIAMQRRAYSGAAAEPVLRNVPMEVPIAIEINGIAYAVMMATPLDIADFVTGFLLGEGLAEAAEIGAVDCHETDQAEWGSGLVARVNLPAHRLEPIMDRARRRLGDSSCGICGIESVEAALRPLPKLTRTSSATSAAIGRAVTALGEHQPLGRETSATHAAAFCAEDGTILHVREDVGRHNALDKLIGALALAGVPASEGFIVMTSRCSYELVEKAVRAGCPLLVAISAPTDLAVRRAAAAGLALAVVARGDNMLWVTNNGL
ncbi:MAG: formate dehydrogenase accessory sulfurtransferase FdhD [Novosphingobium sp.]